MFRLLLSTIALAATAVSHCTRPGLTEAVDEYLSAQQSGQVSAFKARFDNSTWLGYFENTKKADVDTGILTHPLVISYNRSLYDTTACATFTEFYVNDLNAPYVIGTQLRFANHRINKVDTIITKPGDWLFNITGNMYYAPKENWGTIPEEKRDSRDTIKKAADAYCDLFNNPNITVPWGAPCNRLEGGLYGGKGLPNDTCNAGVPSGIDMRNRRYVIDETVGAVDVMLDFGGKSGGLPDSHEFRVEGGKIRYVHTMTDDANVVRSCTSRRDEF
ncbi:uncharacterized protein BDR25DRAFT_368482 [Lindgomyces ingoldianus]|uniref:Uncharacterized protein n=1 Tax=Lindgomyces ingoldianus TaxID=673940 RepID=A0ACB6QXD2_9PLEO|nr:uncharacterized protein BDR25DRAFT_368482 [Lindgomyces ingoldianus]KAF2470856.1 hypothetical protein BDR25DRAFT_368482 [Lindgomyces ingoldianus]